MKNKVLLAVLVGVFLAGGVYAKGLPVSVRPGGDSGLFKIATDSDVYKMNENLSSRATFPSSTPRGR